MSTPVRTELSATVGGLDSARVEEFIGRTYVVDAAAVELRLRPLRGGLESTDVVQVNARFTSAKGRPKTVSLVVKRLDGAARREADLYRALQRTTATLAPRFIGVDLVAPDTAYLYLEYVRAALAWPWREMAPTSDVLTGLAAMHANVADSAALASWDYELRLSQHALWTLEVFDQALSSTAELAHLRSYGPALRRLVLTLPRLRGELLAAAPFGSAILHGDVHSGNVLMRARSGGESPVLIDWGRARFGSPLEDVSSWLHSLGCWEPEVRRRHDTLLQGYLEARGFDTALLRSFRDANWLAAACNSLSGALGYQLSVAIDRIGRSTRERVAALAAVRQHLRVIRRADVVWRS